jgi:hypothetical protein
MQVNIQTGQGSIVICGPYSESNNKQWRELGGKFSPNGGAWIIPDNDTSRETVAKMFGAKSEEVDVLVPASAVSDGSIIQIGGYVIAQRRMRDARVQMPDGVSLAAGSFRSSGGSVKNPRVGVSGDMVFRLRCRKSFSDREGLKAATPVEQMEHRIEI